MLTREQAAGCRATIKSNPKPDRRWRESIFVAALDSIDFLESQLATLAQERDFLKQELAVTEKASAIFEQNSAACAEEFEGRLKAEKERDALREAVRKLVEAADQSFGNLAISMDDEILWANIRADAASLLTPSGEAGKGGGV